MKARQIVLQHLQAGERGSVGQIAQRVGLSPQLVNTAVQQLERSGLARSELVYREDLMRECKEWRAAAARTLPKASPPVRIVPHAIASQPALATVWGRAQA